MPTDQNDRLTGKVAGILTKRELLINRGLADGVEVGMRFAILNRQGIDVRDPDTGEILGSTEVVKTVVKVVRIDGPHLSVGRTFRKTVGNAGVLEVGVALANIYGTPARVETLDIQEGSTLREELNPDDSYVKVGDPVVQTVGDEYDEL